MVGGKFSAAVLAVIMGGALFVGGCTQQKEEANALRNQNETLSKENIDLKNQVANEQAKAAQAQAERDAANQARMMPPSESTGGRGKGGKGSGSTGGDTILTVAGDVLFTPGSDKLTPGGKKELDGIAKRLKGEFKGHNIRIEGYTDSDPIKKSKWASNEALSAARATSVENYFASKGVSKSRMEAVGMGAAKPKSSKKESRRVEIVILGN